MEIQQIVQLTSYQRHGGGTDTVGGTVKEVLKGANVEVDWVYDDTLIGAGAGGTDAVVITIPEVEVPMVNSTVNTNEFAKLTPSLAANALMFTDMAAPLNPDADRWWCHRCSVRNAFNRRLGSSSGSNLHPVHGVQRLIHSLKWLSLCRGNSAGAFFTRVTNEALYR